MVQPAFATWTMQAPTSTLTGTIQSDTFFLRRNSDGTHLDVWQNAPTPGAGTPTQQLLISNLTSGLTVFGEASDDSLTLDLSNGNPFPGGISFDGGGGNDSLTVIGTTAADNLTLGAAGGTFQTKLAGFATINIGRSSVETLRMPGTNATNDLVTLIDGVATLDTAGNPVSVTAAGGTAVQLLGPQTLGALHLTGGSIVTLGGLLIVSGATLGSLAIDPSSRLDIGSFSMIVRTAALGEVTSLVALGFNGGDWKGQGITSTSAIADKTSTTAVGVAVAGDIGVTTFAGQTVGQGNILVKYTYYGDADLNGFVNGDDESLTLFGLRQGGPQRWAFGDFDYSGHVNGDDYSLFLAGLRKLPVL
jgi:hypothetical protein